MNKETYFRLMIAAAIIFCIGASLMFFGLFKMIKPVFLTGIATMVVSLVFGSWAYDKESNAPEIDPAVISENENENWKNFLGLARKFEYASVKEKEKMLTLLAELLKSKLALLSAGEKFDPGFIRYWVINFIVFRRVQAFESPTSPLPEAFNTYDLQPESTQPDAIIVGLLREELTILFKKYKISTSFITYTKAKDALDSYFTEEIGDQYPEVDTFMDLVDDIALLNVNESISNDFQVLKEHVADPGVYHDCRSLSMAAMEFGFPLLTFEIETWANAYFAEKVQAMADKNDVKELDSLFVFLFGYTETEIPA